MLKLRDFNKNRNDLPITQIVFFERDDYQRVSFYAHHATSPAFLLYVPAKVIAVVMSTEREL